MYKITIKNLSGSPETETIIYQSDDLINKFIEKPKLSLEWKQAGSLSFTVLPGHSNYDDIHPMGTFVYAYWDNEELFYGRVVTVDKDLLGKKNIYCEGALSFLKDGEFPAFGQEGAATVSTFFNWCINEYNYSTDDSAYGANNYRHFNIGTVDPELGAKTALFKPEAHSNPQSVMDELLLNRFGGCFIVLKDGIDPAHSPSGHCLNYLKVVGNEREEMIRLCENVRDRTDHDSGESIFTVLRPLGANVGGDNNTPLELSINNGLIEIPSKIAKYGRICKTVNFDDQDTEEGLRAAAEEYIARLGMSANGELPKTCDIKYVDFHYLNPQIGRVGFGDVFTDIEGYENQTMVVGHLELDLENPANDSMSLYNQTYLDAREYSALLESSTGAASAKSASRSGGGSGGSAIAKTLASATKAADTKTEEIKEHFEHKTTETNRELHDAYHIMGVKLDEDTHLPERDPETGELKWAEEGDDAAEIWGKMTRTAWETIINHEVVDEQTGEKISFGRIFVDAYGRVVIDAINNQTDEGTLYVNANKIKLSDGDDGSPEILADYLVINANGYISLKTTTMIEGNILLTGNGEKQISGVTELVVGYGDQDQVPETASGTFTYRGEDFNIKPMRMGMTSPFILAERMLTTSNNDIDLNHSHAITMKEETSGVHSGEVHAVIGAPVSYDASITNNRESFFDIAASQTYINGVAAIVNSVDVQRANDADNPSSWWSVENSSIWLGTNDKVRIAAKYQDADGNDQRKSVTIGHKFIKAINDNYARWWSYYDDSAGDWVNYGDAQVVMYIENNT